MSKHGRLSKLKFWQAKGNFAIIGKASKNRKLHRKTQEAKWGQRNSEVSVFKGDIGTDENGRFIILSQSESPVRLETNVGVGGTTPTEQKLFGILDKALAGKQHIDHYRLRNPKTGYALELDRFYPDLNLAFEYNGVHRHGKKQRARDRIKKSLCDDHGVTLVSVWWHDLTGAQQTIQRAVQQLRDRR